MAQAVKRLYPKDVKLGVGPVIEGGFYYDMDLEESLTPEDLPKIEKEMTKIVNENIEIVRQGSKSCMKQSSFLKKLMINTSLN